MVQIKVKRLNDRAIIPRKIYATDNCFNLFAYKYYLKDGGFSIVYPTYTGIAIEIPAGYYGKILTQPFMAELGITIVGGVINSEDRGEVVILLNIPVSDDGNSQCLDSHKSLGRIIQKLIDNNSPVAQLAILPVPQCEIVEVKELSKSKLEEYGFLI
jgi:dUTPase